MRRSPLAPTPPSFGERGALVRRLFAAVLLCWLLVPFLVSAQFGQDAVAFFVAARVARDSPAEVYPPGGRTYEPTPAFTAAFCASAPDGACPEALVSFVSPPPALPIGWLFAQLGDGAGTLLVRVLMAGCLVLGMGTLWNELHDRTAAAPRLLLATAILMTPLVFSPLLLAQSTPLLFALAAVGLPARQRPGIGRAIAMAAAIALKGFPAALLAVVADR